jgi:hypothetical protein
MEGTPTMHDSCLVNLFATVYDYRADRDADVLFEARFVHSSANQDFY